MQSMYIITLQVSVEIYKQKVINMPTVILIWQQNKNYRIRE